MKIITHAPYAQASNEGGLIHLIANYLHVNFGEVSQLRCNGAFSLCDRDEETSWQRDMSSCLRCMNEQQSLASWSGIYTQDLSSYIHSDEILESRRWMFSVATDQLLRLSLKGINLSELCKESFAARCGVGEPDLMNKRHEQVLRRLLLSAARMCLAVRRFHRTFDPDLCLISGGRDFITRSFVKQSIELNKEIALFQMDLNERCIKIRKISTGKFYTSELMLSDVTTMRSDPRTWPQEVVRLIEDILTFLNVSQSQMSLPLAR